MSWGMSAPTTPHEFFSLELNSTRYARGRWSEDIIRNSSRIGNLPNLLELRSSISLSTARDQRPVVAGVSYHLQWHFVSCPPLRLVADYMNNDGIVQSQVWEPST